MVSLRKIFFLFFLYLAITACAIANAQITALPSTSTPANPTNAPNDPLGRNTPYNCVLGFLKAATSGDYSIAAQYLQMSPARRQSEGEQTAAKLKYALDKSFVGNYSRFNQPEGTPQDGVQLGHQKLGTMSAGDIEVDLDLVRASVRWREKSG